MTLPTIIDGLSPLDRRGLAIFEEGFCHVGRQGVQLDFWQVPQLAREGVVIAHPERPGAVAGAVPPSGHRFENGYGWPMIAHLCSAETTSGHSYTFSSFSFSEHFTTL